MRYRNYLILTGAVAALAACAPASDNKPADATPAAPNVVTFTALDFKFEGPQEIPAGPTTLKLMTAGKEIHHLTLVKLAEGKTFDSLVAAMKNPGPPPAWITFSGGPNAPTPGMESNATMNLEPGNYVVLCAVDTPDHVPHFAKGMMAPLTVTPAAAGASVAMPTPTATATLTEYAFTMDKPLTAGKHVINVVNNGKEAHEFEIIRMEPGKKLADLDAWMKSMQGPPPGAPLGGVAPIAAGMTGQFSIDLAPGSYMLICFLPDPAGKMHVERGMVQEFEVH